MQNAAFEAMGLEICYVPLEVAAIDLEDAIHGLKAMRFLGANITIPHKIQAARLVERLEGAAAVTGTVNTIVNDSGSLVGHNTDGTGFIRSLEEVASINLAAEAALLIGAGGAARSIAVALAEEGISQLAIINRTRAHAEEIKSLVLANFPDLSVMVRTPEEDNEELLMGSKLVINATSAGLEGNLKMPPVAVDRLTKDHVVCDIVYTQSRETPFLVAARGKGANILGGRGMLLHQGAAAFQLWTGFEPPMDVMRGAIES